MGLGSLFSSGGSDYTTTTKTGFAQYPDIGGDIAKYLGTNLPTGANYALNLLQNPGSLLNTMGLYPQQSNVFSSIINQLGSRMSGGMTSRGMLSPENTGAIAGSAATAASPYILPLISSNIENIRNLGANLFGGLTGTMTSGLGSTSTGSGTSRGPGLGYVAVSDMFANLSKWLAPGGAGQGAGFAGKSTSGGTT